MDPNEAKSWESACLEKIASRGLWTKYYIQTSHTIIPYMSSTFYTIRPSISIQMTDKDHTLSVGLSKILLTNRENHNKYTG